MGIFITGGFGYVGSALLEMIARNKEFEHLKNQNIYVLDQFERQPGFFVYRKAKENLPNLKFILGDIRFLKGNQLSLFNDAVKNSEMIIHLCSLTQQPHSDQNQPIIYGGTKLLLDTVLKRNKNCKKIVFVSTTNVYGFFKGEKIICDEKIMPNPVSSYAESKIKAENLCMEYWKKHGIPTVSIRLSTNFGYADGIRQDFFLNNIIWNSLLYDKVNVFGRRDNWRPFIHVKDAAKILLTLVQDTSIGNGELYNVGSEELNVKLSEIIKTVDHIVGGFKKSKIDYIFDSDLDDSVDGESYRVNFSKFRKDFSIKPSISLEDGIIDLAEKLSDKCNVPFFNVD